MSNEPRYPDLEEKELPEQVSELKDYIVNLHRYIRYANNHIDKSNLTRRLVDEINSFVDDDGVIHILDEIDFNERVDFTNYVTFTNLADKNDETVINAGNIKTGKIDASVLNLSSYAKFSDLADENNYTIIHGGNIKTGTISAQYLELTGYATFSDLEDTGKQTVIRGDYITTGTIDASKVTVKNLDASKITSGTIDTERLNVAQITSGLATTAALEDYSLKTESGKSVIICYKSAQSGTNTMAKPNAKVTDASGNQRTWTTKRPQYDSNSPVLFLCWQTETVSGDCGWTTPVKDDTTTVIDGGHITTGTIDAARIAANSITADKLDVQGIITAGGIAISSDITDAINDIEIGGRNLLRGSNEFTYASDLKWENAHWYILSGGNGVAQINTINDAPLPTITKSFSVLNNTTGNRDIGQRFIPTEIGETYTISGYVRIPSNSSYNSVTMFVRLYGSSTDISLNKAITNTEWKYFFVTGQAKTGTSRTCQFGLSGAGDIEYCGVKMEKGNKATDWTPAPEDVDNAIEAKKSTHTLMSSNAAGATYSTILNWVAEGYSGTWSVNSASGVKVGDTVRIGYYVSNMDMAVVYCVGTVTAINSATNLTMISHGLATTVIDGGNILANTVGANQLKVNEINASKSLTIGAFTDATQSEVKNSEIEVGGTNLIQDSQYMTCWNETANGVLVDESVTEGFNSWKLTGTTSNWSARLLARPTLDPIYLARGSDFNLSFEYKCSEDVQLTSLNISGDTAAVGSTTGTRSKYRSVWGTINLPSTNGVWKKFNVGSKYVSLEQLTYGSGDVNSWFFELYCRDNGKVIWLRKLKIELGNKATDWTPAPDDIDDAIDGASQTATKYITSIDSNGISIHAENNANSNYTKINANGMTVYKGGNDVASFGDTARIGKSDSSRFLVNSSGLSAYDSSNFKYLDIAYVNPVTNIYSGKSLHLYAANDTDIIIGSDDDGCTINLCSSTIKFDPGDGYIIGNSPAFRSAIGAQPTIDKNSSTRTSSLSVQSASVTEVTNVTLSSGKWFVIGNVRMAGADGKYYKTCISTSTSYNNNNSDTAVGVGTNVVMMNPWVYLTLSSSTTVRVLVYHNAGSALNCEYAKIQAFKIAD